MKGQNPTAERGCKPLMGVDLNGKCFLKLKENTTYLQKGGGEEVGGMHYKGRISYSEGHAL